MTSLIDFVTQQLQVNQFLSGAVLGGAALGVLNQLKSLPRHLWSSFLTHYTVTVTIDSADDSYPHFQDWVNSINFSNFNRKYSITSCFLHKAHPVSNNQLAPTNWLSDCGTSIPDMLLTPMNGRYLFKYRGRWVWLTCAQADPQARDSNKLGGRSLVRYERITICYLGRSMHLIEDITTAIRTLYTSEIDTSMRVYNAHWDEWDLNNRLPHRSLDSLICADGLVENVVSDLTHFYQQETWYIRMGIPYHRGYLLEGEPGCGKSSLVYAVASHFGRTVYCLSFSSDINDSTLNKLLNKVPAGAILVLEDIDSAFAPAESRKMSESSSLTFATVLNSIDGLCAKHGLVLFMTTNHPERLDPALVRPGRVDLRKQLGPCDPAMATRMYSRFFPDQVTLARDFGVLVGPRRISQARLQQYLMQYTGNPDAAVSQCDNLITGE